MPRTPVHKESFNRKKVDFINKLSLLLGFSNAVLIYIISSYLKSALNTDNIGIWYLVAYSIILALLLNLHKLVRRFGKFNIFKVTQTVKVLSLFCLALIPPGKLSVLVLLAYVVSVNVGAVGLDIILENFSTDKKSGRIRGAYLTMINVGFIFGPLVSTQILQGFDFQVVFVAALFIDALVLFLALKGLKKSDKSRLPAVSVKKIFDKIKHRKNILRIYYISFALEFFYAMMIIYSPIYLRSLGISWEQIGFIFTIMLLPFIFIPYPAGYLADRVSGEKEMLTVAIFIIGASALAIFASQGSSVLFWATLLLVSRIGAATIDTLRDSYFYKRIDGDDVDFINFFRTASPTAYIAASLSSFVLLSFLPLEYVFIFLAGVAFSALYPALRLMDNLGEAELNIKKKLVHNLAFNKE